MSESVEATSLGGTVWFCIGFWICTIHGCLDVGDEKQIKKLKERVSILEQQLEKSSILEEKKEEIEETEEKKNDTSAISSWNQPNKNKSSIKQFFIQNPSKKIENRKSCIYRRL